MFFNFTTLFSYSVFFCQIVCTSWCSCSLPYISKFLQVQIVFLSSLLLSHRSRMFAKDLTGCFSHCCVEGGDHWIQVLSSLFMMVRGANLPPILAWRFPTHWDLSGFSRTNLSLTHTNTLINWHKLSLSPLSLSHTHTHKHIHTEKERKRVCALSLVKGLYPGWKQTSIHLLLTPHKRHETANSFKMHKISFDTNIIKTCEVERLQSFIVLTFFSFPWTTATDPAEPGSWHYIRQRVRGNLWPLYSSPSPRRLQGGHRHSTPAGS